MPTTASALQQANHFSLSGRHLHVDFSPTSFTGKPQLQYQDAHRSVRFSGEEVRITAVPDIGTLASVTLSITPDVGSVSFSLLVPRVAVASGAMVSVTTQGITTTHKTPSPRRLRGSGTSTR